MAFNLSEVLKDVSMPDANREQIEYIPIERIDPNPDNFYRLDGLEELAGSIEMLGLQQPLLVRPAPEQRFVVISGHRRRAAILLIRDGGSDQFSGGVPCIVDRSNGSAALQELKLIMANSDTRKMSSADQNKQAERIEDLLRQLEDEGFEFPGRLRDWVAKLSGMSRSKLARLKVIRDKLDPEISKKYYKTGKLGEESAYELARLPDDIQRKTVAMFKAKDTKPKYWWASTIKQYAEDLQRLETYACPAKFGGKTCVNQPSMIEKIWKGSYRGYCHCSSGKKCCATCPDLANCSYVCGYLQPKAQELRREKKAQNKALKEAEKQAEQPLIDRIRAIWLRFGNALGRANMDDEEFRKITGKKIYQLRDDEIAALEAGEYTPKIKAGCVLPLWNSFYLHEFEDLVKAADALNCSLDYLFLRTDVPEINAGAAKVPEQDTAPAWHTGEPEAEGRYLCLVKIDQDADRPHEQRCEWRLGEWYAYGNPIHELFSVIGWWQLPPERLLIDEDLISEED